VTIKTSEKDIEIEIIGPAGPNTTLPYDYYEQIGLKRAKFSDSGKEELVISFKIFDATYTTSRMQRFENRIHRDGSAWHNPKSIGYRFLRIEDQIADGCDFAKLALENPDALAFKLWRSIPERLNKFENKAKAHVHATIDALIKEGIAVYKTDGQGGETYIVRGNLKKAAETIESRLIEAEIDAVEEQLGKKRGRTKAVVERWRKIADALGHHRPSKDELIKQHGVEGVWEILKDMGEVKEERLTLLSEEILALKNLFGFKKLDETASRILIDGQMSYQLVCFFRSLKPALLDNGLTNWERVDCGNRLQRIRVRGTSGGKIKDAPALLDKIRKHPARPSVKISAKQVVNQH